MIHTSCAFVHLLPLTRDSSLLISRYFMVLSRLLVGFGHSTRLILLGMQELSPLTVKCPIPCCSDSGILYAVQADQEQFTVQPQLLHAGNAASARA